MRKVKGPIRYLVSLAKVDIIVCLCLFFLLLIRVV